jgi:hypothetical protein
MNTKSWQEFQLGSTMYASKGEEVAKTNNKEELDIAQRHVHRAKKQEDKKKKEQNIFKIKIP